MKKCFKCHQEKDLSEFYKHPQMADGRVNKCKECNKIDVIENYKKKIEFYKAYNKSRAMKPHRVAARKAYMATQPGKDSHSKSNNKYMDTHPKVKKAKSIFGYAMKSSKILRPNKCSECPSTTRIEGHHDDYDKPLEVRWLCCKCHHKWHKTNTPLNRV